MGKELERKVKKLKKETELGKELDPEDLKKEDLGKEDLAKEDEKECEGLDKSLVDESTTKAEEEDNKTRYLRLAADFANYKKRSEKERSNIYAYANEKLVTDMLDILDNFDRAFMQENCESDPFMEGISLIYKQFMETLQRAGLSEINAKGEAFDLEFHDALMMEPSSDCESGQIIEVFKKGYMMHKKVIRPSLVKVAQ